jgi:hypothetical protein
MRQMRRIATLVALAACTAAAAASGADAPAVCGKYETLPVASSAYVYQQDEWNSDLPQCAQVKGTSFVLTKGSFDLPTDGPPATYPSFYRGCHWGSCSAPSALPIRVGAIKRITSTWVTKQPASGAYDVTYDLWTNTASWASGQPDGSEIMIWLGSRGSVQPAGKRVASVRLAGAAWEVWEARASGWNLISYRRVRHTTAVRGLDVGAFVDDSVARGMTKKRWYLIGGEAGFEIWKGGKGLATSTFSFRAS